MEGASVDCIVLAADQRVFLWHFLEPGQVHCFHVIHVIWLVLIFTPPPAPGAASHQSFVDVQYRAGYHGSFT